MGRLTTGSLPRRNRKVGFAAIETGPIAANGEKWGIPARLLFGGLSTIAAIDRNERYVSKLPKSLHFTYLCLELRLRKRAHLRH